MTAANGATAAGCELEKRGMASPRGLAIRLYGVEVFLAAGQKATKRSRAAGGQKTTIHQFFLKNKGFALVLQPAGKLASLLLKTVANHNH